MTLERRHGHRQGAPGHPGAPAARGHHHRARTATRCVVERPDDERQNRALHGLTRSLVANMVVGVTDGFSKELEIVGVGYRAIAKGPGAARAGPRLLATRSSSTPPTASPSRCPPPTRIIVKGIDKEKVGQVAADIRKLRKPEPYKGKGVRYAGERVLRKAGKAAK